MASSTVNAIPIMTSNTTPSGIASASSIYSTSFDAWYAFNGVTNDPNGWATSVPSGHVAYKFANPIAIGSYKIFGASSATTSAWASRNPKTWTFEGSNNGSEWIVLDTQNVTAWTDNEGKSFTINNKVPYLHYRLNITSNIGGNGILQISELMMFEVLSEKRFIIKDSITQKHYSFAENTLIDIPSASVKNMVSYGVEADIEIQINISFDKIKFIQDVNQTLGVGKTFTHTIDLDKYKGKLITL